MVFRYSEIFGGKVETSLDAKTIMLLAEFEGRLDYDFYTLYDIDIYKKLGKELPDEVKKQYHKTVIKEYTSKL